MRKCPRAESLGARVVQHPHGATRVSSSDSVLRASTHLASWVPAIRQMAPTARRIDAIALQAVEHPLAPPLLSDSPDWVDWADASAGGGGGAA